jgi:diguanylate cyclase (GGDEF)-like protein
MFVLVGVVIAALLSVLYAYRRQAYVRPWIAVWLLLGLDGFLVSNQFATSDGARLAAGLLLVSKVAIALLLYRSAHTFARTTPYSRWDWLLVGIVGTWVVLASRSLGTAAVAAPAYVLTGVVHARAATIFGAQFRRHRLVGAGLMALALGTVSATNVIFGIFFAQALASPTVPSLFLGSNSLAFLVAAFGMHLLIFEEVTQELRGSNEELRQARDELERIATVDALTGCYNRRFFSDTVGRELHRHRRLGTPLSILFVDIDRFKAVNDAHGHATGDKVLAHFGQFLTNSIRGTDYVVRWGGDEFLVILMCAGPEAAAKAERLKQSFSASTDLPAITFSVGCAEVPTEATEIEPFIRLADQNMYADKAQPSPQVLPASPHSQIVAQ